MITPLRIVRRLLDVLDLSLSEANELASYTEEDFRDAMIGKMYGITEEDIAKISRELSWC
jgi:hypothetical protein